MNYWAIAGGGLALFASLGHSVAGDRMYYRPLASRVTEPLVASVLAALWWIVTLHFALSGLALIYVGSVKFQTTTVLLVAAQFLSYAIIYLVLSLRMRRPFALVQWAPFLLISVLCVIAAHVAKAY